MANSVFGSPITNETLKAMPEYVGKTITRRDRAHMALNMKDAQEKHKNILEYVQMLKKNWGDGISTLCLIYNATGDTIKFVCEHSWYGDIGPGPYPIEIANGQWGGFLHVQNFGPAGSSAAVVYRGLNNDDVHCDWMAAWSNPFYRLFANNTAYTEIREEGHYVNHDHWKYISNLVNDSHLTHSDKWNKCVSSVTTGSDTSPIFEAIFTLEDA